MAVKLNPASASGMGLPTGDVGSTPSVNSVMVTQANDVNWTRQNTEVFGPVLTLTAQGAGTVNSSDNFNTVCEGVKIFIDITAITGTTPTLTVNVQVKDPASGKYVTILSSAALAAVATTTLTIGPALPVTANVSVNDFLCRTWRVQAVVGGTTPAVTATIGACMTV